MAAPSCWGVRAIVSIGLEYANAYKQSIYANACRLVIYAHAYIRYKYAIAHKASTADYDAG